jgi:hypothetical protein
LGIKKNDYKEILKQKIKEELEREYRSYGNRRKIDKNSEEVIRRVSVSEWELGQCSSTVSWVHLCTGCEDWIDKDDKEREGYGFHSCDYNYHQENCKEEIADRGELSSLEGQLDFLGDLSNQDKKRLEELKRKYYGDNNTHTHRERESKSTLTHLVFN